MWPDPEEQSFVISTVYRQWKTRAHNWHPHTDVSETAEAIIVWVEVAGMREGKFTISLDGRLLAIQGERPKIAEGQAYHQLEIPYGEFVSLVELPTNVDSEKIEANYKDGFLRIVLPKTSS